MFAALAVSCTSFGSSQGAGEPPDAGPPATSVDGGLLADGAPAEGSVAARITTDLVALYTFREGKDFVVHDVSGVVPALDLTVLSSDLVSWTSEGLSISGSQARTAGNADKIAACKAKNAISVEAWVRPKPAAQHGPARVVSIARDASSSERIVLLGVGKNSSGTTDRASYVVRVGTSSGVAEYEAPDGTTKAAMQHVVVSATAGAGRLYVDGIEHVAFENFGGFESWVSAPLSIGDELSPDITTERAFRGTYALLAVYCRALTIDEVHVNQAAGPRP